MNHETVLLSEADIRSVISLDEICDTVEETFRAHGLGKVVLPAKITLDINPVNHQAWMNAMPAYVEPLHAAGIKWAGGFVNNPRDHNLPYVMATIVLNDPVTGQNLAVMDGAYITNARTGAAAAVSAKYLARLESSTAVFIGAGMQARWTLRALTRYFELEEVRLVDIRPVASEEYIQDMRPQVDVRMNAFDSGDEAVEGADIVFTATTAETALIHDGSIGAGTTVVSLGSYQELDDVFVLGADKIVVDSLAQCRHRGELARFFDRGQLADTDIYSELGEIVAGGKPGRDTPEERNLVVPIGLGSVDIAVARRALSRAEEQEIGQRFASSG